MSNFEYCIGFQLPKKLNRSSEGFAKGIEEKFPDFHNKLSERPAHIKVKSPFAATKDELEKLSDLLTRFSKKQESIELTFDAILFFDKDKLALSVTESEPGKNSEPSSLKELKIDLCLFLSALFPERVSSEIEPVFIPRVTLGFYREFDDQRFINFCDRSFEEFSFPEFSVQEIVLFERNSKNEAWRVRKKFPLQKKVLAVM